MDREPPTEDDRSEYEHTEDSGTHNHIAREYNTGVDEFKRNNRVSVANCEVCGDAIPPTRNRCTSHQKEDAPSEYSNEEWSISRIAIAIVTATTYYHAVSKGAAAFTHRNQETNSRDSFDLIYDFNEDPSKTLTRNWGGELPDAVKLNSEKGADLYEIGKRKTQSNAENSPDGNQRSQPATTEGSTTYIYLEDGTPIQTEADLKKIEDLRETAEDSIWGVTAVLYKKSTPHSTQAQQDTHQLFCTQCGQTEHIYRGSGSGGVWECLSCNTETQGSPQPEAFEKDVDLGEIVQDREEEHFEEIMNQLEEQGDLP